MKKYCLLSSTGIGRTKLTSFDNALLNSNIANYNLVKVSSILPARAKRAELVDIEEGSILHTAYASLTTSKDNERIAATVAVGIPEDPQKVGVIMEYSDYCSKELAEERIRAMVKEAMDSRGYSISKILCASADAVGNVSEFVTVFAALAMWD